MAPRCANFLKKLRENAQLDGALGATSAKIDAEFAECCQNLSGNNCCSWSHRRRFMISDNDAQICRRKFCSRALWTSAGLALAATEVNSQRSTQTEPLLAYPPKKIEGAERLMPR